MNGCSIYHPFLVPLGFLMCFLFHAHRLAPRSGRGKTDTPSSPPFQTEIEPESTGLVEETPFQDKPPTVFIAFIDTPEDVCSIQQPCDMGGAGRSSLANPSGFLPPLPRKSSCWPSASWAMVSLAAASRSPSQTTSAERLGQETPGIQSHRTLHNNVQSPSEKVFGSLGRQWYQLVTQVK